jgi:signal transduction histidine kinase
VESPEEGWVDRAGISAEGAPLRATEPDGHPDGLGEAFFQSVVENLSSGILVTDREGRVLYGNDYTRRWSGISGEALRGMVLAQFCPGIAGLAERGETSGETSCGFCRKNCYIGFRLFPIPPNEGVAGGGHIVSFTDLSHILELRRTLRLKERLAAMGEVISRVAHEIRNPLFALTGAAQILARELELTPKHAELLDSVLAQGRRLNGTIQSLLDYSREISLNPAWFDLRAAAAEVVRTHPLLFALRGVRGEVETGPPVEVFADEEHVRSVIHRLVENAAEASGEGSVVEVAVEAMGEEVALRVLDRGRGVAEPDRDRIFHLYFTTKVEGRGLGLPLSRKIAEAHGGTLSFAPRPGGGAVFTLVLPRSGRAG